MKIPSRGFYRHVSFVDVMVNVLEIKSYIKDKVQLMVAWWNKTYDMPIGIVEVIGIKTSDLHNWVPTNRRIK